jgi:integrase/recombinase XerD
MSNNPIASAFAEHLATFLERLRVLRYSPATLNSREYCLRQFFRWLQAKPDGVQAQPGDVRDVSKQTVRDFQQWLLARFSIWTAHAHLIALRRFFEHLEATDVVLVNPTAGVPLPKKEDRLPRSVLTAQEVKRILDAPDTQTKKGIRDQAILETFYSTGIRLEEMARLTIHDVDHVKGFVRVNKGKGAKDRVVPLGSKACDYVREYLQHVRADWIKDQRDERALWLSWRWPHQPLKKQIVSVMVRHYARAAGITKQASPHTWRHTCATHLVSNGANIAYAQRLLGHRRLSTTQIYTRVSVPEIKATHAQAHPRKAGPSPRQKEVASAPLETPPVKTRAAYRYKK